MDLGLVKKGLDYSPKRRKWVLLLAALGFSGFGVYRVYHSPSLVRKREKFLKLLGTIISIAEAISDSASVIGVVSKEMNEFVQSDSDKIPNSFRQISKITLSGEFSESVIGVTRALTLGILRAYHIEANDGMGSDSSFPDQVLDNKLFSTAGSCGFASVVVGSFARNLVMALFSGVPHTGDSNTKSTSPPEWVNVVCSEKCRELIGDCIQLFVSTSVTVYLDKTMHINPYDELFSGLTNPKHEQQMKDVLASVCNGAVETLVRTSNQVLTSGDSNVNSKSSRYSYVDDIDDFESQGAAINEEILGKTPPSADLRERNSFDDENEDSWWVNKISTTLAVPNNRKFVLDVTGRVTFESVRSFLDFFLEKLCDGTWSSLYVVHEVVVDWGLDVVRYVKTKSSTIFTICISLCLHILGGVWILVPA